MSNNLSSFWANKWTTDLKEWGIDIPEGISHDDLKALHAKHKVANKPSSAPSDMSMLTPDQVVKLVDKLVNERLAQIGKSAAPAADASGLTPEVLKNIFREVRSEQIGDDGLAPEGYVPPEDYIEPVKFFVPFARYYVLSKQVGPVNERLPYGLKMLRFEPQFAYYIKEAGVMHHRHISVLEVSSRKVYEYITGMSTEGVKVCQPLPEYGRVIFKDAGAAAASEQTAFAQMVQRHYTQLATKPLHELVQEHQRLGKPTASSWGISDYAWSIASHRADIEMSNIHDTQARSLREASAARALLKSEGLATA